VSTIIDWSKPIETVPNAENPVPVPARKVGEDNIDHWVKLLAPWFYAGEDMSSRKHWFVNKGTNSPEVPWLPEFRNVEEHRS
jgi:hypothetical protein